MNTVDFDTYMNAMARQHALVATAPSEVNKIVDKLLVQMGIDIEPEQVALRPEPYCRALSCYYNVAEKVRREGGKIHYGWAIWQSQYLCQAEHHAVWENDRGELLDITPREGLAQTIFFVSDNKNVYQGKPIARIEVNATTNSIVDNIIYGHKVLDWLSRYETRIDTNHVSVPSIVDQVLGSLDNPGPLRIVLAKHEEYFLLGNKPNNKCYCCSNKIYKNCHGRSIEQDIFFYLNQIIQIEGEPESLQ